jgi:hypothetical protein
VPKIFLLDDDIDPTNLAELTWAIATRVHPTRARARRNGFLSMSARAWRADGACPVAP